MHNILAYFITELDKTDIILFILGYVLTSFGIMQMMIAKDESRRVLAFVPIVNNYMLGVMLEDELRGYSAIWPRATRWILAIGTIVTIIPTYGILLAMIVVVYFLLLNSKLGTKYHMGIRMFLLTLFGLSGIGYIFVSSRMMDAKVGVNR